MNQGCLLHLEEAISLSKVVKAASELVFGGIGGSEVIVAIINYALNIKKENGQYCCMANPGLFLFTNTAWWKPPS